MEVQGDVRHLDPKTEVAIFLIVQEALSNVRRHSDAKDCLVTMSSEADMLKILIQDNGKGFEIDDKTLGYLGRDGKLGILDMQERAKMVKGTFRIASGVGQGTFVPIELVHHHDRVG